MEDKFIFIRKMKMRYNSGKKLYIKAKQRGNDVIEQWFESLKKLSRRVSFLYIL